MKEKMPDPSEVAKAKNRVDIAKARILLHQPFYGVLLSMIDFISEQSIPTMATDGNKIWFSPQFTNSLTDEQIIGAILHEISHCIYLHCTSKRRMNRERHKWNVATDYAINLEIKNMQYSLPEDVLLDNKFREMNAEQIYDALPEKVDDRKTLDTHIESGDESSWDDMEDRIITAYEMTKDSKGRGELPAGIRRWIDKIRKNKVRWERVFHKYVGQALAKDDYSYVRVNKRFLGQDIYLPDMRSERIGNVIVAVDTSGSIGKDSLEQFAAEVHKIAHLVSDLTVMTCDAAIHEVVKVNQFGDWLKKIRFKGGGGTSHKPVFDHVNKMTIKPDLFIGLTDMYSDIESIKRPHYPVLWVSTSEIKTAPFGHVVQMPIQERY